MSRFKLYIGLKKDGNYYNYASIKKMEGGKLAILDGADKSVPSRMLNILKGCVDKFYTESGDELQPSENDLLKVKFISAKQIVREYMKSISKDGKHVFTEFFRCPRCSDLGNEKFTEVFKDWDELIDDGEIIEHFSDKYEDSLYETILPIPIEISEKRNFEGGSFDTVIREPLSLADGIDIANDPFASQSERNMICSKWDKEIVGLKGMDNNTFKAFVKRKGYSFSKEKLTDEENQEAMDDELIFGMDLTNRVVRCKSCNLDIGGHGDFTNFFSALFQSNRKDRTGMTN